MAPTNQPKVSSTPNSTYIGWRIVGYTGTQRYHYDLGILLLGRIQPLKGKNLGIIGPQTPIYLMENFLTCRTTCACYISQERIVIRGWIGNVPIMCIAESCGLGDYYVGETSTNVATADQANIGRANDGCQRASLNLASPNFFL